METGNCNLDNFIYGIKCHFPPEYYLFLFNIMFHSIRIKNYTWFRHVFANCRTQTRNFLKWLVHFFRDCIPFVEESVALIHNDWKYFDFSLFFPYLFAQSALCIKLHTAADSNLFKVMLPWWIRNAETCFITKIALYSISSIHAFAVACLLVRKCSFSLSRSNST